MLLSYVFIMLVGLSLAKGFEQTMTAEVGQKLKLPCRLPPNTPDSKISWYLGKKQLTYGMIILHYMNRLDLYKPAPNEMVLIIKSVVKSDEAVFTCKSHEQPLATITVNVQWKPEIIQQESSKTSVVMVEGSRGELKCVASGQPRPNITWHRRAQDERFFTPIGVTGEMLTIEKITRFASDVFMCNASNAQGDAQWEMNVTVHFPVEVSIYETDMEVETGQQVIMTCIIQGAPLKEFSWVFDGKKIKKNNWKYLVSQEHDEGYPVYFLTLMIRPSTLGDFDFGSYTCHAEGWGTEAQAAIQLKRKPKEIKDTGYNVNP